MPATMMHLLAGNRFDPAASDAFYLGCILPDCVDADRELKDRLHFRTFSKEERLPALLSFVEKTLDLKKDFDRGVFFHFFLDYLWDFGPQQKHRDSYRGEKWFLDYRKEISDAGSYIARTEPWAKPLWERLHDPAPELWQSGLVLPETCIREFLDFNFHWHTEVKIGPSAFFPPEAVEEFTLDAVRRFGPLLAEKMG